MSQLDILGGCALITAIIQLSGFAVAYAMTTEKFYDILGGLNFLVLAFYSVYWQQVEDHPWSADNRKIACTVIFTCSRAWLLIFLAWRAHERGGDARFDDVKDKFGRFLTFWIVQGVWVFAISMPMVFVNSSTVWKPQFSTIDLLALVGFALGVILEMLADIQKALWVNAGRTGGFCQSGVWSFSRHPNYFGEMLQWWCVWVFAYASGSGISDVQWWVSIISPLFTMQILMNTAATGVAQANGKNLKRYYDKFPQEYTEYRENTSILMPMVGYKYVPLILKRTIFMDFKCYEYRVKELKKSEKDLKSE